MLCCRRIKDVRINVVDELRVNRRLTVGALAFAAQVGGLACSSADMSNDEFGKHESALVKAADDTPRVSAAPTYDLSAVQPLSLGCPIGRYYAVMQVEPELTIVANTMPSAVQPSRDKSASGTIVAAVGECPFVEGFEASNQVNGVCIYDANRGDPGEPDVPGALAIARCPLNPVEGGGPPDEKSPLINNYYSELDMLLLIFRTSELKVQLVRDGKANLTIVSGTTALTPYTRTVSALDDSATIRADFVQAPSGWFSESVDFE